MINIPFSGSKRYSYKRVREIASEGGYSYCYEPFGGSCVLSLNLQRDGIVERSIANDYDRFFDLYPEYLDIKDKIVEEGYKAGLKRTTHTQGHEVEIQPDGSRVIVKSRVLNQEQRKILQDLVLKYAPDERIWRYLSLGSNFTHSAVSSHEVIRLKDFAQFGSYLKTDKQREYLDYLKYLKLEHLDWRDFLDRYKWELQDNPDALIILDPPYTGTYQKQYEGQFSWEETKELIDTVRALNCDFIFFNNKEDDVKEWLDGTDYTIEYTGNANSTANRKRKDVMAYVRCHKR